MAELLAPAGSMEALKAAIMGGADAIYVGGSRFNARAYATNFDIEELKEAVKLCHLHNVRLFVTVNTVYKECEIKDLYQYLCDLYSIQVDALIVQDEGIMRLISKHFKDFEVHASTQCSIHNVDGVKHYQELGLKRVVVARENSIEEIKAMVKTGCEIETFVHGALCVSYSGQCFMSQGIGKRSANRGMCAQPCRLPYELYLNDEKIVDRAFLMSCKDLCTIEHIHDLIEAGVTSFKIEGRMKRPEYVYAITAAYRHAIDNHQEANIETLKQLFNRDFTRGYLFHENKIISSEFSGNRGIPIGTVLGYDKKNHRLKIKSQKVIHQGDGIRIGFSDEGKVLNKLYFNKKLVNQVEPNSIFEIDYEQPIKKETLIYRTTDIELERQINHDLKQTSRKHPVSLTLTGKVGDNAVLTISDGVFEVSSTSDILLEKAQKPTDFERLEAQLKKLGNTIYEAKEVVLNVENTTFIPITLINKLRSEACLLLDEKRSHRRVRYKDEILPYQEEPSKQKTVQRTYLHVHTQKQILSLLPISNDEKIYLDLCEDFIEIKQQHPEIGLVVPTICNEDVFKRCDAIVKEYPEIEIAVNNVGAYHRYQKNVSLLLPGMNLSHQLAHNVYEVPAVFSLDMDAGDEKETLSKNTDMVRMTYGYVDSMTTKHCIVSYQAFGKKIENCHQCLKGNYHLEDRMHAKFPLMFDDHCIVHVLSDKPIKRQPLINQYLRFTLETPQQIKEISRKYRNN